MCHKCGQAGHVAAQCTQGIATLYRDLTYRCPFCRALGGIAIGHEWDVCKDCKLIRMGTPTDDGCGICGHPEHLTPQCPSIQGPEGVILLDKMQTELLDNGWTLNAASTLAPAAVNVTAQPTTPSPSQSRQERVAASSPSISSTGSTVSLPISNEQETRMAIVNDRVYGVMRGVIREELETVNKRLDSVVKSQDALSKAVEMQGGNIESMTEMLDDFGTRLGNVEVSGTATNQRLARMRAKYQHFQASRQSVPVDQASEHSQDDHFQDAQAYDPSHPSDYTEGRTGTQQSTGLESPRSSMIP
jgi:hypothetical protein